MFLGLGPPPRLTRSPVLKTVSEMPHKGSAELACHLRLPLPLSGHERKMQKEDEADDTLFLDESFFVNRDYDLTTFTFGSHVLNLFCLRSASTDYDLTGQLVWPGAVLLNNYLSKNAEILEGHSVIELGSGVGITGILCSRFCREVVLTDHNEDVLEIMKKNIEIHLSSSEPSSPGLTAEKLEWGNSVQISEILQKHPGGFDLVLGADIYILSSIPLLFNTVEKLLHFQEGKCRFILAYVSRAKR
ncbi:protein N-lysine methyltransferase METTL21A-like isoform X2 [Phoenix dactylifera]|uniref:Protein N-lysine methyltransferase METTL21A-like isoform X2 n=1 Tax=Phoenix dactylifera TaxID=42345 RepID=A0A8B8ZY22_PHODC|nr:protein N-lysine methyltransferase METTL21A-like isoform X2 [Phoenix dactylifera]XP_038979220.1 protein N-lysine methyltransferase METTL21A-like isoform X2 [Phoenix dactylifera]